MNTVDGTRLKEYLTCPRIPYLTFHRPRPDVEPSPRMRLLMRSGRRLERQLLAELEPFEVDFPAGDLAAGFAATRAAIERRVPAIAGAVLLDGDRVGRPDLLLFDQADELYEVADIKSSQQVHASARLQVAFYARLLATFAPAGPRGWVIVRDGTRIPIATDELRASVDHLLDRLEGLREGAAEDPSPHRTEACGDCRFDGICRPELDDELDLGRIPGLTRAQRRALEMAGAGRAADLADAAATPHDLAQRSGLPTDSIRSLGFRAAAVLSGEPLAIPHAPPVPEELRAAELALAALVDNRSAEPTVAIAGMVLGHPERFRCRLLRASEGSDPEREIRAFVGNLQGSRGPILAYGPDVVHTLDRLGERQPVVADALDRIRGRVVDLRAELRRRLALPDFDRTAVQAARAAGIDGGDDAPDLNALAYLESEPDSSPDHIEVVLHRDLLAVASLAELVRGDRR